MCGEEGFGSERFPRPALAKHLKHCKGAVTFVQVHAFELVAQRLQGAYTTDAQQVFLPDACAVITSVKPCTQANEVGRVVGVAGIEKEDRHCMAGDTHDVGSPNFSVQGGAIKGELDAFTSVGQVIFRVDGCIRFGLFASFIQMLTAITLPVKQAESYQWDARICSGFDMVARQDTKATGVGVQLRPQADFCGEIRQHRHQRFPKENGL